MTYVLQTFKSYYFQWDFDVVFSLGYFLSKLYYKNLQIHKNITHQNWSDCKSIQANEQLELALLYYVISHVNIIKNFTSSFTNFMPLLCLSLLFFCTILDYSNNVEQELRTDIFALFLLFEGDVQCFIIMILILDFVWRLRKQRKFVCIPSFF